MDRISDEINEMFDEQYLDPETELMTKNFNYCEWYASETAKFIMRRKKNNLTGGKKPDAE